MSKQLLYGVAYYYEYLPEDRMEEDFTMMEEAGINVIRIAESTWSTWEPQDGVFDFTYLHRVLEAAQRHGLSVIVGTPTYAVPAWLAAKCPDLLCETHRGTNRYGARQNFDITNPGYLFHAERIIRRLMLEVKDCPAVIGYQLDNETKAYDTCGPRVQQMFRSWLKERFGSVEALNKEFGFAYWSNSIASWEDLPDVRGTINGSFGAAFACFQRELVTKFLSWQRQIVDEYRRPDQFVTHNFDYEWRGHSFGVQPDVDHFAAAEAVTIAGCDIYHPSEQDLTGAEITFCGAMARALKKSNYLVLETEAQGNFGWLPYPGQLRLQAFSHVANSADGVSYWHWHSIHNSFESYWKGLLSHDFSKGAVYREACTVGRDFARISEHVMHLRKANRVALMVSNASLTGFQWFPAASAFERPTRSYNDYVRWMADALYRLNVEYDVIPDSTLDFSEYDVVLFPALYAASEELTQAVRAYVAGGGHVIASFRSFFCNRDLKIYHDAQPHGLTDCFGMSYDRFTRPVHVGLDSEIAGWPTDVAAADWMELLELPEAASAKALCTYVHPAWGKVPAVTWNEFGDGAAVYLGCYFDGAALEVLLRKLFKDWGIELCANSFPVVVKSGINTIGRPVNWFLNYSDVEQVIEVHPGGVELLGERVVTENEKLVLPPWGAAVIETR
jgi:beta-galactosidase